MCSARKSMPVITSHYDTTSFITTCIRKKKKKFAQPFYNLQWVHKELPHSRNTNYRPLAIHGTPFAQHDYNYCIQATQFTTSRQHKLHTTLGQHMRLALQKFPELNCTPENSKWWNMWQHETHTQKKWGNQCKVLYKNLFPLVTHTTYQYLHEIYWQASRSTLYTSSCHSCIWPTAWLLTQRTSVTWKVK